MKKAKLTIISSLVFLLLVNITAYAYAASEQLNLPTNTDPQKIELPSVSSLFFKLIISLVIIVLLAYYSLKFLRRNMQSKSAGDTINVLDQHAFGLNRGIFVTEIGDKVYVLGVTDHNINLVTEITDTETINEMRMKALERQSEPVVPANLTTFLKNLLNNGKKDNLKNNKGKDFKSHIQAQVNKLQNIFDPADKEGQDENK